jgi:molybdopterin-guanine dinucleotide biosynthesis protein A
MAKPIGENPSGKVPSKKPRVSVYVSESIKEDLEKLAAQEKRSVSNLIYAWIVDKIEESKTNGDL